MTAHLGFDLKMADQNMNNGEEYPYPLHTNNELAMMLAGTKPFAAFAFERIEGWKKSDALAQQDFDTHVASGIISEHLRTYERIMADGTKFNVDYYFYALEGEEWRVEAYCLLLDMLHRFTWSPELEWLQGKLLGYTDEQNKYHLSRTFPDRQTLPESQNE